MNLWPVLVAFIFFQSDDVTGDANLGKAGSNEKILFQLFTKSVPHGTFISKSNSTKYLQGLFRKNQPLKMVVHGWLSSITSESVGKIVEAYTRKQDVNAIGIGIPEMLDPSYQNIVETKMKEFGLLVAEMVNYLVEAGLVSLNKVHLIGHSLGAHVMGLAGPRVTKGKVARITGLDPAGPIFEEETNLGKRLDASDAVFVDIIHTALVYGFFSPLGKADFYPNGGKEQPGCPSSNISCHHHKAWQYFAESIYNPKAFPAIRCDPVAGGSNGHVNRPIAYMGEAVDPHTLGKFYLRTNDKSPYGTSLVPDEKICKELVF